MTFHELDTVVLERDLPEHDLRRGDLGAIVHRHGPDVFEVEFVRASGQTQAVISLAAADIRSLHDEDLPAVRAVAPRRGAA
jgi:hypothetical protein